MFRWVVVGVVLMAAEQSWVSMAAAADAPPQPVTLAATTQPATLDADELSLMLKPLTQKELLIEANGWFDEVRAKVRAISDLEIAAGKAEGDAKTKLLEQAAAAREARTRLTDRLNLVLGELKSKGGARDEFDTYIAAVSGLNVKVNDVSGAWTTVLGWLKSPEGGIRYGKNIVFFIGVLVIFRIISGVLASITNRALGSFKNVSKLLRDFTVNTVSKVTFFVGFVVALSMLEVNIGPFLAAMGAIGFVIGFALQGTLSNFASGIMILLYRPYDLNDHVTVGGVTGVVQSMTLVSTVLKNKDAHIVTIPNSAIWGGTITNLGAAEPAAK